VRIVIAGVGAIGGYIGARLARAGAEVAPFARGPHLLAMQARGLKVIGSEGDFEVKPNVSGDLHTIGQADVIEPGVIRHTEGNKISLGEPDGTRSERARRVAEPLIAAGAVVELGERLGVAMPATQTVYACAKMLDDKRRSAS
jgi:ketopantoate reductase